MSGLGDVRTKLSLGLGWEGKGGKFTVMTVFGRSDVSGTWCMPRLKYLFRLAKGA